MDSFFEIGGSRDQAIVALVGARVTLGRDRESTIPLDDDLVSRAHAVVERVGSQWTIQDLGSTNGTRVNGERIWSSRALREGDIIEIGSSRLRFRTRNRAPDTIVGAPRPQIELTAREREILRALCRPLAAGDSFADAATTKEIAAEFFVSDAAVRQHLMNLYRKLRIPEDKRSRLRLANEALRRGVVTVAELRGEATATTPVVHPED